MILKSIAFYETVLNSTYQSSFLLPWPTFSLLSLEEGEGGYEQ